MGGLELAMVVGSALLHATWGAAIKGSRDPLAFNVAQGLLTLLIGLLLIPWAGLGSVPASVWGILAATGVAHGAYWYGLSRSLTETDYSLAYPIIRSTPAFLPWIAVPFLGERITAIGALGVAVVVLGIWALRGSRSRHQPERLGLAYFTLATTVAYSLLDKQAMVLISAEPWTALLPRSLVLYFLISAVGVVGFLPLAARRVTPRSLRATVCRELRGILGAAVIGVVGYGLILEAYRTAPASYVVAVRQLSVLFALVIAVAVFGERASWRRVLGATATV
ncbi:MAG: EamA family transporter, partial [Myxococcota bacterium]